jgi:hypothetical protein
MLNIIKQIKGKSQRLEFIQRMLELNELSQENASYIIIKLKLI